MCPTHIVVDALDEEELKITWNPQQPGGIFETLRFSMNGGSLHAPAVIKLHGEAVEPKACEIL